MSDKGQKIVNQFLTQGHGKYYCNIICKNPDFNRSYEIPQRIIHQILTAKLRKLRKWLESYGEEKDYEKFIEIFGEK